MWMKVYLRDELIREKMADAEQRAARNQLLHEMRQPGRFESALRLLFYVIRARMRDGRREAIPVRQVPVSDQGPRMRW
jgi:hypothetical protein